MSDRDTALVLFSGGQDSTTCLAWALDRFGTVETVGFDYGQRHASELAARPRVLKLLREKFPDWRDRMGADHVLSLDVLKADRRQRADGRRENRNGRERLADDLRAGTQS